MPEIGFTGFRPPEIKLPDELRPKLLSSEPKTTQASEENWTPEQTQLANVLLNAFRGEDSLDPNIHSESITRPLGDLPLPNDVKIEADSNTISYQGQRFVLPPALQINKKTKTITYTPGIIGASNKVVADQMKGTSSKQPPVGKNQYGLYNTFAAKQKPLTPTQQAQAATQAREAAETAQRIQQAAQQAKAATAKLDNNGRVVSKSSNNSKSSENNNVQVKPNELELSAEDIISQQKSMTQTIEGARIVQEQHSQKDRNQEVNNAVTQSAERTVGTVKAAEGASQDANNKNEQDRRQAAFVEQESKNATTVVQPGKPGKFGKGKK